MKKFVLPLLVLSLIFSCKKEVARTIEINKGTAPTEILAKTKTIPAVTICNQTWMQKNLDVTTYRNGDPIIQVTNPAAWSTTTIGAWCYYQNDPSNDKVYGKLYNWHAVNDSRGLAPAGWHVPSDAEWTVLTDCLGGAIIAGGLLKEKGITHWTTPNTAATNSSRFTALPGGNPVSIDGLFVNLGLLANFWTSTAFSTTAAYNRRLVYNSGNVQSFGAALYADGFSVRCVKD